MTNYKKGGARINYTNAGGAILSGGVVVLKSGGALGGVNVGIAVDAIAATTGTGDVQIAGVFGLAKTSGEAYAIGDNLYWTGTAITSTSSGNTWAGVAAAAAASGDTTADTLLNGLPYSA